MGPRTMVRKRSWRESLFVSLSKHLAVLSPPDGPRKYAVPFQKARTRSKNISTKAACVMAKLTKQTPSSHTLNVRPVSQKNYLKLASPQLVPATCVGTISERLVSPYVTFDFARLTRVPPLPIRAAPVSKRYQNRPISVTFSADRPSQSVSLPLHSPRPLAPSTPWPLFIIFHQNLARPQHMPATCVGTIPARPVSPYVTLAFPENSSSRRRWRSASERHIGRCQAKWSASEGRCIIDA